MYNKIDEHLNLLSYNNWFHIIFNEIDLWILLYMYQSLHKWLHNVHMNLKRNICLNSLDEFKMIKNNQLLVYLIN